MTTPQTKTERELWQAVLSARLAFIKARPTTMRGLHILHARMNKALSEWDDAALLPLIRSVANSGPSIRVHPCSSVAKNNSRFSTGGDGI